MEKCACQTFCVSKETELKKKKKKKKKKGIHKAGLHVSENYRHIYVQQHIKCA